MPRATLRARGQLTLPPEVRKALGVEDGDEIEFDVTGEGVTVRGYKLIPADQAWFWSESWQAGEHEVDSDLDAGRTTRYDSDEVFLKSLGTD